MILKAKELRTKVKLAQKQINKSAIQVLDNHISQYIDRIILKNTGKRITEENIQL